MSHMSFGPERKAPGDEPHAPAAPPTRRRLAIGTILMLNAGAALFAWLIGSALVQLAQALVPAA
jgi:hypothetical protein